MWLHVTCFECISKHVDQVEQKQESIYVILMESIYFCRTCHTTMKQMQKDTILLFKVGQTVNQTL